MKKYIFVLNAIELLAQLMNGKRVKGVLYLAVGSADEWQASERCSVPGSEHR